MTIYGGVEGTRRVSGSVNHVVAIANHFWVTGTAIPMYSAPAFARRRGCFVCRSPSLPTRARHRCVSSARMCWFFGGQRAVAPSGPMRSYILQLKVSCIPFGGKTWFITMLMDHAATVEQLWSVAQSRSPNRLDDRLEPNCTCSSRDRAGLPLQRFSEDSNNAFCCRS